MAIPVSRLGNLERLHRWVLTIVAVGGGTSGVLSCVAAMEGTRSASETLAVGFLMAIYMMGLIGGTIQSDYPSAARKLCIFFFLAQIPVLESAAISYRLLGPFSYTIAVSFHPATLNFSWFLGTDWELSLVQKTARTSVGLNLVPLALTVLTGFNNWKVEKCTERTPG